MGRNLQAVKILMEPQGKILKQLKGLQPANWGWRDAPPKEVCFDGPPISP